LILVRLSFGKWGQHWRASFERRNAVFLAHHHTGWKDGDFLTWRGLALPRFPFLSSKLQKSQKSPT
jgi:hypothetical protein